MEMIVCLSERYVCTILLPHQFTRIDELVQELRSKDEVPFSRKALGLLFRRRCARPGLGVYPDYAYEVVIRARGSSSEIGSGLTFMF